MSATSFATATNRRRGARGARRRRPPGRRRHRPRRRRPPGQGAAAGAHRRDPPHRRAPRHRARWTAACALGALATHAEIAAHPLVRERFTALADASAIVGSHATRAQGTLGGNLMNASPAMETGGPLDVLRRDRRRCGRPAASARWPSRISSRAPGRRSPRRTSCSSRSTCPLARGGTGSAYVRLEYRRQMEIAVVGATAVVDRRRRRR